MKTLIHNLLILAGLVALLAYAVHAGRRPPVVVEPVQANDPCPVCPAPQSGKISLGGAVSPDGASEVDVDLPVDQRLRNIGSRVDGAGMCVSTSITHSARWQNLRDWSAWRDWCAQYPGGSYPAKTDRQVKQFAQEKAVAVPAFVQYEGTDPSVLRLALATGRLPSVTYAGRDGVRYRGPIAHMVNLVHLSERWAAVMDNNGRPEDLIWMSPAEFLDRWTNGGRGGWAFVWLTPPPPPPPCN